MRPIAIVCATLLLVAIVAPRELARTSWRYGEATANDSPAGYVDMTSFGGVIALAALVANARPRRPGLAAPLLAAGAFAVAAYGAGSCWLNLAGGAMAPEGRIDHALRASDVTVVFPPLLPVFLAAALIGLVCSAAAAVRARR